MNALGRPVRMSKTPKTPYAGVILVTRCIPGTCVDVADADDVVVEVVEDDGVVVVDGVMGIVAEISRVVRTKAVGVSDRVPLERRTGTDVVMDVTEIETEDGDGVLLAD